MNKTIIAGLAAGILLAGLVLAGPLSGLNFGQLAQAQDTGTTKKVTLIADEVEVQVAPDNPLHPGGVMYKVYGFNGTTPGPVISVDQGDTIEFTLINQGELIHSIDFHAGYGPSSAIGANASATGSNVEPGQNVTWTWKPPYAGVFYYHCAADGLNGIWEHIANGMYGGIVVHPANEQPAKEFYVVFGEIYSNSLGGLFESANGTGTLDMGKFLADNPDLIMTNGMAFKYVPQIGAHVKIPLNPSAEIFQVKPGELTRWYIVNGGPNGFLAFHIISGMIDVRDGSIKNRLGTQLKNDETWTIPPGSGSVIEATFPEPGIYVGVTHAINDALKGGAFVVMATPDSTPDDHPAGTMVPPKGSAEVTGPTSFQQAAGTNATSTVTPPAGNATGGNQTTTGNQTSSNQTGAGNSSGTGASDANNIGVSIVPGSSSLTDNAYDPNPEQVSAGGTVTWTNHDSVPHTAVSGENGTPDGKFDSGILTPNKTFSHKFDQAGEYPYFCMLHPNMVGTVSVS